MKNGIRFTTFCQFCRSTRDDYGVLKGNLSVMTVLSAISNVRFCLALKNAFDSTSTHKRNFKKCLEICFAKKKNVNISTHVRRHQKQNKGALERETRQRTKKCSTLNASNLIRAIHQKNRRFIL